MIGCCTHPSNIARLHDLGFDFIEIETKDLNAGTSGVPLLLPVHAINSLIPKNLSLFRDEDYYEKIIPHIAATFRIANDLGTKVIVMGSSKSRIFLPSYPYRKMFDRWVEFLRFIDKLSCSCSLQIGLEPLPKSKVSFLNTITETAAHIYFLNLENIGITLDVFHFLTEKDSIDSVKTFAPLVKHIHIAGYNREFPYSINSEVKEVLSRICDAGYQGSLSIEAEEHLRNNFSAAPIPELRLLGF